ncbi:MAG: amidohydrolase [Bacteroidales bacterium]|nr:amidohydrolase [Bacteroidales bacterium]
MPDKMNFDLKKIIDLRMKLHRMPELSGLEYKTSELISNFISKFQPSNIVDVAKTGKAFVFDSGKPGFTIMFRAELDALPIDEPKHIFNKSLIENVSHKCGHDGHMAILAGLAQAISNDPPVSGKVILLFQPAEENLMGAQEVIDDPNFTQLQPNFIFALHNIPGFEENSVIVREGNFTSATTGVTISLSGNTSHAANPEKAINPSKTVTSLLHFFEKIVEQNNFKDFVLITPVFVQIGTPDFGITPGNAEIKLTIRAYEYADLDKIIGIIQDQVKIEAEKSNLKYKISFCQDAPPVLNSKQAVQAIIEAANDNDLKVVTLNKPFKWTEDFGFYTIKYKAGFFGIGAGNIPDLHDKNYEFPDNIIISAIKIFYSIYTQTNK